MVELDVKAGLEKPQLGFSSVVPIEIRVAEEGEERFCFDVKAGLGILFMQPMQMLLGF